MRVPQKRKPGPLFQPPVEGKLMKEFEGLDVGDQVRGKLMENDVERRFSDFSRAEEGRGLVQGETHVLSCPMKPSLLDSEGKGDIH